MRGKLTISALMTVVVAALLALALVSEGASADGSPPAFVQQVSTHSNGASVTLTPTTAVTAGNRMVVMVGIWNSSAATAKSVTDSAGNTYTEILHFKASENTEESVWTAPVTAGAPGRVRTTPRPRSRPAFPK